MAQGMFQQAGMDFDPEAELRARQQQNAQRSLGLVQGMSNNPGVQGAANGGALLGAALGGAQLTPDQQRISQIQQDVSTRTKKWLGENPDASEEDKAFALHGILADSAIRNGRTDIGTQVLQATAAARKAKETQDLEIKRLGYQVDDARSTAALAPIREAEASLRLQEEQWRAEQAQLGELASVYDVGETNPDKSRRARINPHTGAAEFTDGSASIPLGKYTTNIPKSKDYVEGKPPSQSAASSTAALAELTGPALDVAARQHMAGQPLPGRGTAGNIINARIINREAQLYAEDGDGPKAAAMSKIAMGARSAAIKATEIAFSKGPESHSVRANNVVIHHLGIMEQLGKDLNNTQIPLANTVINFAKQELGDDAPTSFDSAKSYVAKELVKAIIPNGVGAVFDRKEAEATLLKSSSWSQLNSNIRHYKDLLAGQTLGLKKQYEAGTEQKDFDKWLLPKTKEALSKLMADSGNDEAAPKPKETAAQRAKRMGL